MSVNKLDSSNIINNWRISNRHCFTVSPKIYQGDFFIYMITVIFGWRYHCSV